MECVGCHAETDNPKFCSRKCSTFYAQEQRLLKNPREVKYCPGCEVELSPRQRTWCGTACYQANVRKRNQEKWLEGKVDGLRQGGVVTDFVKQWLRDNRGDKCELCGWDSVNPRTKKVPVVADHVDGNYKNNRPENLRLLCPSCDSLQPTYCGSNRGKGRGGERSTLDKSTVK